MDDGQGTSNSQHDFNLQNMGGGQASVLPENSMNNILIQQKAWFNALASSISGSLSDLGQNIGSHITHELGKMKPSNNCSNENVENPTEPEDPNGKRPAKSRPRNVNANVPAKRRRENPPESDGEISICAPSDIDEEEENSSGAEDAMNQLINNNNESNNGSESECEDQNIALKNLISDFKLDEECGPDINPTLAEALKDVWCKRLTKEKAKKRLEKYNRPENCKDLRTVKVNPEIFGNISDASRSHDIKMQKMQTTLVRGTIPVVQTLDILMRLKPNQKIGNKELGELKQLASDTIGLLSHANQQILQMRRNAMSPQLSTEYKQLKTDVPSDSTLLFGDDLKQRLATIKATNKASKPAYKKKYNNFNNKSYPQKQSKNFKPFSKKFKPYEKRAPYKGNHQKNNNQ